MLYHMLSVQKDLACLHEEMVVIKIIMGVIFVIGGLSGKLVLIGTQSGPALAIVGVLMIAWGVVRLRSNNS